LVNNMNTWNKYLAETRKNQQISNEPYQRKVRKGYVKDRNTYLKGGPIATDAGGSGYKKKPPNSRALSAPPMGEVIEPETFEKHAEFNPKYWQENQLNPNISKRLMKIAREFLEGLELPVEHAEGEDLMTALVEDVRLTGSMANYNWSKYSDVDVHIVVDFSKIDENTELVKAFFDSARMRWNDLHDIMIYGHEVEVYVENINEVHHSSGVYSIVNDEWLIEPDPDRVDIDFEAAQKKSTDIDTQIGLIEKFAADDPRAALKSIERLKKKIRRMRKAGLDSPAQEYSAENIAFKILRRNESLDKLSQMKYDAYDAILSIGEEWT